MAHGKLVHDLGPRYFFDRLRGSYFVYDNIVAQLHDWAGEETFVATTANGRVNVPSAFFSGYDSFKWPEMGYRKLGQDYAGRLVKAGGSAGIRQGSITVNYSPLTDSLLREGLINRPTEWALIQAAFLPQFDSLEDFPAMFAGDRACLVLSGKLMVEPTSRNSRDEYDVMYRGNIIGSITPNMQIAASTQGKNREIIRSILNVG